jgi:hypothetical protein
MRAPTEHLDGHPQGVPELEFVQKALEEEGAIDVSNVVH